MPGQAPDHSRARAIARVVGAITGVVVGIFYAGFVISNSPGVFGNDQVATSITLAGTAIVGAAALALAAPLLTVEPYLWLEHMLNQAPVSQILGALVGVLGGLVIAALVAVLLSPLPLHVGTVVSLVLAVALVNVGARTATRRRQAFAAVLRSGRDDARPGAQAPGGAAIDGPPVVVDTSALIDGRITEVAKAGFVPGRLLIAGFVLEELQRVADSGDPLRRARGRRGLSVLEELQRRDDVVCEITDLDFPEAAEVDARLIKLAVARSAVLMTSDHNLNRIARIAGVRVLNLNDLANALKPILSAGEEISIAVVREGKELHQGVGYLDDGTMVVVENAKARLGDTVRATVTSVLQTSAGRMIFATTDGPDASQRTGRAVRSRAAPR
ncbi:MAG: TRAM domain-containing protein [Candidatus Dormibacteraeota bacterium]|uniref:PIN domain nuclease n=1 Tax=Candidatus Aeolococcus gillhamiae TaxID=3127015 RepID=A0A2W5Z7S8_9BACT|nr:TRAM domain-containing protein [Candidatus Dormibacteraeota bacterium]PZR78846.1 MAG: PIN domain nuclease [Candidatus Dormibacter sp. RRmetagenome_bin12]